jgi:hypothetical protein
VALGIDPENELVRDAVSRAIVDTSPVLRLAVIHGLWGSTSPWAEKAIAGLQKDPVENIAEAAKVWMTLPPGHRHCT